MANRRQLVKRRKSVRNIRKITRTMQLIATARFQQAMTRAVATRPYAQKLAEMVERASRSAEEGVEHPLLRMHQTPRVALVVITSKRGLCGGYNANVLRTAAAELEALRRLDKSVDLHVVGKKGIGYFRFLGEEMASRITHIDDRPRFEQVAALADRMMESYGRAELGAVKVAYVQFLSAGTQRPAVMQLLPIVSDQEPPADPHSTPRGGGELAYDFSPPPEALLANLLPAAVRMRMFQCFTEAAASEQVARMVAMKAATDAASDMIKVLTQQYNRARQTAITMELLDIIGGVAAIQ